MAGPRDILGAQKALRVLELLNAHNGARLADIVRLSHLPKSTAYRVLESLRRAGYLAREGNDSQYFLTSRVRRLADGYDEYAWISEIGRPLVRALGRELVFPVIIATPLGTGMVIRETTETQASVLPDHYTRGTTLPLFTSASGKVYLAWSDPRHRETLRQMCAATDHPERDIAAQSRIVEKMVQEVHAQGYALSLRSRRTRAAGQTSTVAVPILAGGRFLGALALRYLDASVTREQVRDRFLGALQCYATRIGQQAACVAAG